MTSFNVITNEGGAFSDNGRFTAPLNGTYFFLASAGSTYGVGVSLKKEGVTVSQASVASGGYGHNVQVSCHATLRLSVGQRVWMGSWDPESVYSSTATAFTGFLLSVDD